MKITDFSKAVTLAEGKKVNLSIAQVKEVLRIVDEKLDKQLYPLIRKKK